MPGILPMKVIKVGSNAQARIAQACDRCRSKKIRCDGVRPSCTQCINVGFECKTSDKLSRRAFPRGYTESLEERVRQLEAEVRELKDLLDEREEKIDVLSKCQSLSPRTKQRQFSDSPPRNDSVAGSTAASDELIRMTVDPASHQTAETSSTSAKTLISAFKTRVARSPKSPIVIDVSKLSSSPTTPATNTIQPFKALDAPPRVLSDQLINIFFQQWAPLYPIFSRSGLLKMYQEFTSKDGQLEDKAALAQLYLIFSIAADSSQVKLSNAAGLLNAAWRSALATEASSENLDLLRCYALAMIRCLQQADYSSLSAYQGLAVGLTYRLGLDKTAYNPAPETRDSAIRQGLLWTIYMLDAFAAAQLSVPTLLRIDEVTCLPPLGAGSSNTSGALAIAQANRILADTVAASEKAKSIDGLPSSTVTDLVDRLEYWYKNLPAPLAMQFAQDKPSTNVITSQSPMLAIYFYHVKALIYRLPLCSAQAPDSLQSTATNKLAESSKRLVQLVSLLEERGLSFAMPLNKAELLVTSGIGVLFQSLDVIDNGAMMKDHQRTLVTAHGLLTRSGASVANEFIRIGRAIASPRSSEVPTPILPRRGSDRQILSAAIASLEQRPESTPARTSMDATRSLNASLQPAAHTSASPMPPTATGRRPSSISENLNLDYLSFGSDQSTSPKTSAINSTSHQKPNVSIPEWERLLSNLDLGAQNLYDSIYGGSMPDQQTKANSYRGSTAPASQAPIIQLPHGWHLSYEECNVDENNNAANEQINIPRSHLSFSDESITSGGDEFTDLTSPVDLESYASIVIPQMSPLSAGAVGVDDGFEL